MGAETARIDLEGVYVVSAAAALDDSETEGGAEEIVGDAELGADQRAAVRRVGDRSVDHRLDAALGDQRHPTDGLFDNLLEAIQIGGQQLLAELRGHAVDRPRRRRLLVGAEDQAFPFLAQVERRIDVAQQRQLAVVGPQRIDVLGDHVLVLHRHHGQRMADHGSDLAGPETGRVD